MPTKPATVIRSTTQKRVRSRRARSVPAEDNEFYGGLIRLHILHHAAQQPMFGLWLIEELRRHGYRIGPDIGPFAAVARGGPKQP